MLFGTSNFDRHGIINNTVAFGKAGEGIDVPVVLTTVETKSVSRANRIAEIALCFWDSLNPGCSRMNFSR